MPISEAENGWTISFEDAVISALEIDFRFGFRMDDDPHGAVKVIIETPFSICEPGKDEQAFDPSRTQSLAEALRILNAGVISVIAQRDGRLTVNLLNGLKIEAGPNKDYESWHVISDGHYMLTCGPGAVVALFTDNNNPLASK